jgi:hypothetical protein
MIPRVLKRLTALGAALLVLVFTGNAAAAGLTRAEARLLRDLNRVRAAHGLVPLRYDPHLQRAARAPNEPCWKICERSMSRECARAARWRCGS